MELAQGIANILQRRRSAENPASDELETAAPPMSFDATLAASLEEVQATARLDEAPAPRFEAAPRPIAQPVAVRQEVLSEPEPEDAAPSRFSAAVAARMNAADAARLDAAAAARPLAAMPSRLNTAQPTRLQTGLQAQAEPAPVPARRSNYNGSLTSAAPPAQGLAGWVVGALQGRVRIKWKGSSATGRAQSQMELVETLSLGGKRQVMLIECQGERYLVGCGTDTVATIEKLSPETRPAAIKAVAQTWL